MNVDNMDDDEEHRVKRTLGNESNDTDKNDTNDAGDADDSKKKKEDSEKSAENIDSNAPQQDSHSTSNENTSHSNKKTDRANDSTSGNASDTDNTDDDADTQKDKKIPLHDGDVSKSDEDIKNASNKNEGAQDTLKDNKMNDKTPNGASSDNPSGDNASENTGSEDSESARFIPPAQAAKKEKEAKKEEEEPMGLLDHLSELRRRLTRVVIILFIGFFVFYGVSELAYSYLALPLTIQLPEGSKLIYTSPQGAFFTYLKVSLMLSILGTSPFTFYQIWAFIAPGLYKEEQSAIAPLAFFSAFFFLSGAAFCYFMVFPVAFKFFLGFTSDIVIPMISVEEYLSFALKLIIAFGLVFEMPLFSYFLAKMRIITPEAMRKHRKYAVLGIFVVAAILTPPDVFSQTLMAIPMLVLYEISIYVAQVARGQSKKKEGTEENTEPNAEEDINDKINNFK